MESVILPEAPILALLGDIGVMGTDSGVADYRTFLKAQAAAFKLVLVLAGNRK